MSDYNVTQKFIFMIHRYKKVMEKELAETGIHRGQHYLLMYLAHHSDASQTEIANCLKVSTATIAVATKRLEKGGYINKVVDGNDNRFNKVMITEKGASVVKQSEQIVKSQTEEMYDGFSEEELMQLGDFLDRIYENLGKIMEEKTGETL